jgi:hypothetical protein
LIYQGREAIMRPNAWRVRRGLSVGVVLILIDLPLTSMASAGVRRLAAQLAALAARPPGWD